MKNKRPLFSVLIIQSYTFDDHRSDLFQPFEAGFGSFGFSYVLHKFPLAGKIKGEQSCLLTLSSESSNCWSSSGMMSGFCLAGLSSRPAFWLAMASAI